MKTHRNLDLWLDVNGVRRQSGNTRTMIFGVRELVSYCSHYISRRAADNDGKFDLPIKFERATWLNNVVVGT